MARVALCNEFSSLSLCTSIIEATIVLGLFWEEGDIFEVPLKSYNDDWPTEFIRANGDIPNPLLEWPPANDEVNGEAPTGGDERLQMFVPPRESLVLPKRAPNQKKNDKKLTINNLFYLFGRKMRFFSSKTIALFMT